MRLLKNEAATKALSKQVTELFKEGRIGESFTELRKYWPLREDEIATIEGRSAAHFTAMRQRLGRPIRSLKIKEEKILDVAVRETYFIQFEYTAIRLLFTYYHNAEGWLLHTFVWDDSFTEEFK